MWKIHGYLPDKEIRALLAEKNFRQCVALAFPSHQAFLVAGEKFLTLIVENKKLWQLPWCGVRTISWDQASQILRIDFSDPSLAPLELDGPQTQWLTRFGNKARAALAYVQVLGEGKTTPTGAVMRAQVCRDENGKLFSFVTSTGELNLEEQQYLDDLERQLRLQAGLDPAGEETQQTQE